MPLRNYSFVKRLTSSRNSENVVVLGINARKLKN